MPCRPLSGTGGPGGVSALWWCKAKPHDRIACQLTFALPSLDVLWLQSGTLITSCGICQQSRAIPGCGCRVPPLASVAREAAKQGWIQDLEIPAQKVSVAARRSQSVHHNTDSHALHSAVLHNLDMSLTQCCARPGYRRSCGADTENGAGSSTSNGSSSTATAAARAAGSCGEDSSSFAGSIGPRCRKTTKRTQYKLRLSKIPPAYTRWC